MDKNYMAQIDSAGAAVSLVPNEEWFNTLGPSSRRHPTSAVLALKIILYSKLINITVCTDVYATVQSMTGVCT